MAIPVSSSVIPIEPDILINQGGLTTELVGIVPDTEFSSSFYPGYSFVEFHVYGPRLNHLYQNPSFTNYKIGSNPTAPTSQQADTSGRPITDIGGEMPPPIAVQLQGIEGKNNLELYPEEDLYNQGFATGNYFSLYNFLNYELGSDVNYFISEISGDRTEVRLQNNGLDNTVISSLFSEFQGRLNAGDFADEFYLNFGENRLVIGVNLALDVNEQSGITSILIKLYDPLPDFASELSQVSVVTKTGESLAYEVSFEEDFSIVEDFNYIQGPNVNIPLKDLVNNSTDNKSFTDLNQANSSASFDQLHYLQNRKGLQFSLNYNNREEFIHFSSAKQRLENFKQKLTEIESYKAELSSLLAPLTGNTTGSSAYSASVSILNSKIDDVKRKFDGYEYFLYYTTGSNVWPKINTTTYPYPLYSVTSSQAKTWLGSDDESDPFYSVTSQIYSASVYDENNPDYLYYLIPPFISQNEQNAPYLKFVNMSGQLFDDIWLYTKNITEIRNNNNALTGSTLPLDLAGTVIESLGMDTYGNDFNVKNDYAKQFIYTVPSSGSLSGSSGIERITDYVDVSKGQVINYYDTTKTTLGYIVQLLDPGYPYPVEGTQKEIYKRIFANMVSLVKRKGTVQGLRQLINIWGVPNTMLRISEFGGKNKIHNNDWDLWYNRYSQEFLTYNKNQKTPLTYPTSSLSASVLVPWRPLTRNAYKVGAKESNTNVAGAIGVPDCIQFRFKTARNITPNTQYSESLFLSRGSESDSPATYPGKFGLYLHRSASQTGSFSGSIKSTKDDPYYNYANLHLIISGSKDQGAEGNGWYISPAIYGPFYNKDWWSVQVQRKTHLSASVNNVSNEYELLVGQKGYEGADNNKIKYLYSSSITMGTAVSSSMNEAWNYYNATSTTSPTSFRLGSLLVPGNHYHQLSSGLYNSIGNSTTAANNKSLGRPLSGSLQEFRYYARALSQSQFFDYVMNPRSIEGLEKNYTGSNSSFDLLAFRLPLGNELEFQNTKLYEGSNMLFGAAGTIYYLYNDAGNGIGTSLQHVKYKGIGSVHPASMGYVGPQYTSSFLYSQSLSNPSLWHTSSQYKIITKGHTQAADFTNFTSSFVAPNNEVYYLDQPSAGIRNRNSNKIIVANSESYGKVLSPYRSMYQNYPKDQPYNENINSLEVGFSFQNEINDDIIGAMGHGVISDIIGDATSFYSTSSYDRYPRLTKIAEQYFKKYSGTDLIYGSPHWSASTVNNAGVELRPRLIENENDYNRLIKFYETSLFKAIKNFTPARTSISTGIIIKPHLLERSVVKLPHVETNTKIAVDSSRSFNTPINYQNLVITSSINMEEFSGGVSNDQFNQLAQNSYYETNVSVSFNSPGLTLAASHSLDFTSSISQAPANKHLGPGGTNAAGGKSGYLKQTVLTSMNKLGFNYPILYTGSYKHYTGSFVYKSRDNVTNTNNVSYIARFAGTTNSGFAEKKPDSIFYGVANDPNVTLRNDSLYVKHLYSVFDPVAGYNELPLKSHSIGNPTDIPLATNLYIRFATRWIVGGGGISNTPATGTLLITSSLNRLLYQARFNIPTGSGLPFIKIPPDGNSVANFCEFEVPEFILYPGESFGIGVANPSPWSSGPATIKCITCSINFPKEDIHEGNMPYNSPGFTRTSMSFNYQYPEKSFHQTWVDNQATQAGIVGKMQASEKEFYDGEYSGSEFVAVTGEANPGCEIKIYKPKNTLYHVEAVNYQPKEFTYLTMSWVAGTGSIDKIGIPNIHPTSSLSFTPKYDSFSNATGSNGYTFGDSSADDQRITIFFHEVPGSYTAGGPYINLLPQKLGLVIDGIAFARNFFLSEPELFPIDKDTRLNSNKPDIITDGTWSIVLWIFSLASFGQGNLSAADWVLANPIDIYSPGAQGRFGIFPNFGRPRTIQPFPSESFYYHNTTSVVTQDQYDSFQGYSFANASLQDFPYGDNFTTPQYTQPDGTPSYVEMMSYNRVDPYFMINCNDLDNIIKRNPMVDSQSAYNGGGSGKILKNHQISNTTMFEFSRGDVKASNKGFAMYTMLFGAGYDSGSSQTSSIVPFLGKKIINPGDFGVSAISYPYSTPPPNGYFTHSVGRAIIFSQSNYGGSGLSDMLSGTPGMVSKSQHMRDWKVSDYNSGVSKENTFVINSFARAAKSASNHPYPGPGSSSVFFYQPTFTESGSYKHQMPFLVRINYRDLNGNNNQPSMQQQGGYDVNYLISMSTNIIPSTNVPGEMGVNPLTGRRRNELDTTQLFNSNTNNFEPIAVFDHTDKQVVEFFYSNEEDGVWLPPQYWLYAQPTSASTTFVTSDTIINFDPYIEKGFYNSDCNPTMNNENENRDNPFYMDVDYSTNPYVPVNIDLINKRSAIKAQVPQSNYTQKSMINPRYDGVKLSSANYNEATNKTEGKHTITFLNGDTGSWGGDTSYGPTAVVEKSPVYIAHFKEGIPTKEKWDSMTFRIDGLIEVPNFDVKGQQGFKPSVLTVDGGGDRIFEVASAFEKGRKVIAAFDNTGEITYTPNPNSSFQFTLDWGSVEQKDNTVHMPAMEFQVIDTNQRFPNVQDYKTRYIIPSWIGSTDGDTVSVNVPADEQGDNGIKWMVTGSGEIVLKGKPVQIKTSTAIFQIGGTALNVCYRGPHLALLNTLNTNLYSGEQSGSMLRRVTGSKNTPSQSYSYQTFGVDSAFEGSSYPIFGTQNAIPGKAGRPLMSGWEPELGGGNSVSFLPSLTPILNTNDPDNYFRFSPTGSGLPGYQDFSLPLQIREGDAIRVTYTVPITGSSGIGKVVHQTFSVIGYNLPPPIISASSVNIDGVTPQNLTVIADGAFAALKLEQGAQDYFVNKTDLRGGTGTTQRYSRNQELILMGYGASGATAMVSASFWGMSRDYYGPGEGLMLVYKWADNNVPTSIVNGQYKWMITTNTMLLDSGSGRNFTTFGTPQASYFNWDSQIILSGSYNGSSAGENTANAQANYYESSSIMIDPIIGTNAVNTSTPRYIPDPGYIYDRLRVSPDPSTLKDKIPNGVIKQYTIYRPTVEDNRVIVNMTPPTGSRGTISPSSEGYLIPDDLTQVQKDNIETIINELRSMNAFSSNT